jgi:hypothetical protein
MGRSCAHARRGGFAARDRPEDATMILGLSMETFTLVHVAISLIGILSGIVVVAAMLGGRAAGGWTALFLIATVATSVTGFFFPLEKFGPPHVIGIISLVLLAVALYALYGRRLGASWRATYIVAALVALYLNVFVGVVQAFQKVPVLQSLAPTQSEPPFLAAQTIVLFLFVVFGFLAVRRFHPARSFA